MARYRHESDAAKAGRTRNRREPAPGPSLADRAIQLYRAGDPSPVFLRADVSDNLVTVWKRSKGQRVDLATYAVVDGNLVP